MDNLTNNIPKHWQLKKLGEVCEIQTGKYDANHAKPNGKYRFYTCAYEYLFCDTNRFSGESLILPGNGANVGEVFYYNGEFDAYQRTYVLNKIQTSPKYLYYHLLGNWRKRNQDKQFGSATNYIRMGNFTDYIVPIPPLPEQQAIVAKIEELFSKLENGKQQLLTAQQQLKVYRQSLLKWAFEGKLTNKNVKEGELPKGWKIEKLGEVCEIKNGKNQKQVENPNGKYPIYGSAGIMGYADSYLCEAGSTIVGRKGTINKPLYVNEKFWNVDTAFGFMPNTDLIVHRFLYFFCLSFNFSKLDKSTTIPSLAKTDLQKIDFVVPPLKEQRLIVLELESKLTVCDKIEETINQSLQQAETLKQSILKKAFEGKLVAAVAEQKETKVIPLYKPKNEYFYQMQLLGIVAKASKQKQIEHGEMTLAKYAYLMDKVYNIPTYYEYNRWHLGPYPPIIKKAINNKQYFKKSGNHIEVLNEKTLFNSTNPYTEKIQSAVNELSNIFSKYSSKERSHKTELLATVCKVIEDIQSTNLKAIRQSMAEWKINLKDKKHKTKAEKFNEPETEKCLAFIKEKGWDKKLIK